MDLLMAMRISASGLSAQRTKLNVVAQNLANAETTRTEEGGPYRRKMVVLSETPLTAEEEGGESIEPSFQKVLDAENAKYVGVSVSEVVESQEDFRLVYRPSHPDADPLTGYVAMPNVNFLAEMGDMIVARRAYDANATVIANTKAMIQRALELGR